MTPRVPGGASEVAWHGSGAVLRPGVLAFTGTIGGTRSHAHHAVQIVVADGLVTVVDGDGRAHTGAEIVIPPDTEHRIDTGGATGIVVFLDPDSPAGRGAVLRVATSGWCGGPALRDPARRIASTAAFVDDLLTTFAAASGGAARPRHPAVVAAVAALPAMVARGPVRTGEVAAVVGLSASRLTHLFTAQVGLPLRRYILWLRLMNAAELARAGRDLTTIAHATGFADSAHLTRTCREIFGLPPSALTGALVRDTGGSRIVQAPTGDRRPG
ncbi:MULTISPECIES: helix-turn-helix transcriptional regulator [unclassified Nocardia]|uniref:helix-turn-helix transcriptional regulator n=1 Tax=unclassified Nocardia TaxID=2637762 RepID=UPI0033A38D32